MITIANHDEKYFQKIIAFGTIKLPSHAFFCYLEGKGNSVLLNFRKGQTDFSQIKLRSKWNRRSYEEIVKIVSTGCKLLIEIMIFHNTCLSGILFV